MARLDIDGLQVNIDYKDIDANQVFILPTLELTISISTKVSPREEAKELVVTNMTMAVILTNKARSMQQTIGYAKPVQLLDTWALNMDRNLELNLPLDHYVLSQIEKVREGGNLHLKANIRLQAHKFNDPASIREYHADIDDIEVPKSKWVEEILPNLNYKNVSLIEIPQLSDKNLSDVISHLNNAWKKYSMGEPDEVLRECRIVLEGLGTKIKEAGFEKEDINDKDGKKQVPDWEKFFGHEKVGDVLKHITQKIYGFTTPASHWGKSISIYDAYFALMQTFSIAYYVISRFRKQSD